jgi:hypothetical protein
MGTTRDEEIRTNTQLTKIVTCVTWLKFTELSFSLIYKDNHTARHPSEQKNVDTSSAIVIHYNEATQRPVVVSNRFLFRGMSGGVEAPNAPAQRNKFHGDGTRFTRHQRARQMITQRHSQVPKHQQRIDSDCIEASTKHLPRLPRLKSNMVESTIFLMSFKALANFLSASVIISSRRDPILFNSA